MSKALSPSRYASLCGFGFALTVAIAGCTRDEISMDDPELQTFVQQMIPRQIEVLSFTRPVDLDDNGDDDGIEVVVNAEDAAGDPVKCFGNFQFEVYSQRMASADRLGERIAHWSVDIAADESRSEYWDALARHYRFPLELPSPPLKPGKYWIVARLRMPVGDMLDDQYPLAYRVDETTAPSPLARDAR